LALTDTVTVALPVPLVGLTLTHEQGLDAVQEQPLWVLTLTETVPPAAEKLLLFGDTEKAQLVAHSTITAPYSVLLANNAPGPPLELQA
jgi:hypothetical protein